MRTTYFLILATVLFSSRMVAQVVGPYTGTTRLTNITGPCSPATLAILGDADFTDGSYEISLGSVFEGTWASGLGYADGPGDEILCVSLHTEESWMVRLRLSDGSYSNSLLADMTPTVDNNAFNLYDCGAAGLNPGWTYDRRVALLDFASFTYGAGLTVVGAEFTLMTDNAGVADPIGMLYLTTTPVTTPPTISNNGPLCQGQSLILDAQNTTTDATYSWSGPNGFSSTLQSVTIPNFTSAEAGTYTCVVTDTLGVDQVFNLTTTVVLNPQPSGNITFASSCEDQAIVLGFSPIAGQTISSYNWNLGVGTPASSVAANPSVTFANGGSYPVSVTLTTSLGCTGVIDTLIPVYANPVPSFSSIPVIQCAPAVFTMNNTTNPADVASFSWIFDNGINSYGSATLQSPSLPGGVYDVQLTVTSPQGCVGTTTVADYLTVENQPIADFYWNPGQVLATNTDISLVNSSVNATNFQWTIDQGWPSSATTEDVQTSLPSGVSGNYNVTLIVSSAAGCTDSITKTVEVSPIITLYIPNTFTPDGDEFNQTWQIFIDGVDMYSLDLRLYNRWGQTVWENHDPSAEWDGTYNGEIVPSGLYTWTLSAKDKFTDEKYEYVGHVFVNR
ncbi:MAG: gliding motility-associated C-terminal domain-containing protein [Fluviicola sp.]|nr:gliding motility-associated C-terminal domain-containing protein [Fluviicola sp.]